MITSDYICGLVDGEGSFTVFVRNPDKPSQAMRRVKIEPRFYLKLAAKDSNILYELKDYFRCGNVYIQRDRRPNHQNCYRFEVANRKDLWEIIIPFFKNSPLRFPSKIKDFSIFCEIMELIRKKEHLNISGQRIILNIKRKMH